MKTKTKTTGIRGLFVAALIILSAMAAKAQPICNHVITNNLACDVTLNVSFSENNPTCLTCPGSPISITVQANTSYVITCSDINNAALWACSNPLCDMSVTMTSPIVPPTCNLNNSVPLPSLPASCAAGPGALLIVSPANTDINP